MKCNCAGTAPGYPQHEAYCGQEPDEDSPLAYWPDDDWPAGIGCPPGCTSPFCACPGNE